MGAFMTLDTWLAVAGLVVGVVGVGIAVWQWRAAKKQGDLVVAFLHGLKTGPLNQAQVDQVNDMLARLDPPHH